MSRIVVGMFSGCSAFMVCHTPNKHFRECILPLDHGYYLFWSLNYSLLVFHSCFFGPEFIILFNKTPSNSFFHTKTQKKLTLQNKMHVWMQQRNQDFNNQSIKLISRQKIENGGAIIFYLIYLRVIYIFFKKFNTIYNFWWSLIYFANVQM